MRRAGLLFVLLMMVLFGVAMFQPALSADTTYFSDDFESGLGKWIVSGKDWAIITTDARGGTHSVTDSPGWQLCGQC